MRAADVREVEALGTTPLEALLEGLSNSERCYTFTVRGFPAAMFGVSSVGNRVGSIWLLGTDRVTEQSKTFGRLSRPWVRELGKGFAYLGNYVHAENTVHVRWLKWVGAEFLEPEARGPRGEMFYPFLIHV